MEKRFNKKDIPKELLQYFEEVVPEPIPCVILDCFLGSGTSAVVAERLGRKWVGIELSPDYADMAIDRIEKARDPGAGKQEEQDKLTGQRRMF